MLAQHLRQRWSVRSLEPIGPKGPEESKGPRRNYINGAIALVAAVLISHFFVGAIAQNVATSRDLAPAQPAMGQIIFAVIVAFGIAAFVIKRFLNLSYIWPAVASVFLTAFADALYYNSEAIQRFAETRPATSFPHSVLAILPLQLVALGTVGSIIGYWLAVRYEWWRKHESA